MRPSLTSGTISIEPAWEVEEEKADSINENPEEVESSDANSISDGRGARRRD